jgi:hypothetical protein
MEYFISCKNWLLKQGRLRLANSHQVKLMEQTQQALYKKHKKTSHQQDVFLVSAVFRQQWNHINETSQVVDVMHDRDDTDGNNDNDGSYDDDEMRAKKTPTMSIFPILTWNYRRRDNEYESATSYSRPSINVYRSWEAFPKVVEHAIDTTCDKMNDLSDNDVPQKVNRKYICPFADCLKPMNERGISGYMSIATWVYYER